LTDLKQELNSLRVQAVSGNGNANKSRQIRSVRKAVARVLTILSEQQKGALQATFAKARRLPLDMRAKKTRALRRRLTLSEAGKKTLRQKKRDIHFPKFKFVLKP
jgi:large subunit ribosomal protein L35e